ncbi:MAG: dihydrofolate reductase family protein [Devosia sp.]
MAKIVGYIAASLDGFIADPEEGLRWLTERQDLELGQFDYNLFLKRIRTVVMGRATYDWVAREGMEWPYAEQRSIVVTSRPLPDPIGPVETRSDVDALVAELRALDDGDVWMLGGGQLQMAFMERGALDELEVYVISQLLGGGYPLFPPTGFRRELKLLSADALGTGGARLYYSFS